MGDKRDEQNIKVNIIVNWVNICKPYTNIDTIGTCRKIELGISRNFQLL